MKKDEREAYINYRLKRANETWEAAVLLFDNGKWNSAVNRLYYACFYAVSALLVRSKIEAKTHNGIKTQFFMHFIKTGKLPLQYGQLYTDLFSWRQEGDYDDFVDFNKEDIEPLIIPAEKFIALVHQYCKTE